MHVEVRSLHIQRADAMRFYAENCIESRFRRLSHAVGTVVLRIRCVKGSRTAGVQQCQASLHLTSGEQLILSEMDDDVYRAIDRIVRRIGRSARWLVGLDASSGPANASNDRVLARISDLTVIASSL